jgi:hypothetical protein
MIAFLVFLALMIACIIGCVCISMRFYSLKRTRCLQGRQLVTLSQEAFIEERSRERCRGEPEVHMNDYVWRVCGIALAIVTVMFVLVVAIFRVAL